MTCLRGDFAAPEVDSKTKMRQTPMCVMYIQVKSNYILILRLNTDTTYDNEVIYLSLL